jgi:hypothetical protein
MVQPAHHRVDLNAGDLFLCSHQQGQSRVCYRRWRPRTHMFLLCWSDRNCVKLRARVRVGVSRDLCSVRARSALGLSWLRVRLPDGQARASRGSWALQYCIDSPGYTSHLFFYVCFLRLLCFRAFQRIVVHIRSVSFSLSLVQWPYLVYRMTCADPRRG